MAGWLAKGEDPKKLKELLTNIVAIEDECYNKVMVLVPEWKKEM